jgi:pilus assembly protein CpaC
MIRNCQLFVKRALVKRAGVCGAVLAALSMHLPAQNAEDLRLTINKSVVIDYPSDIQQITISSPEVMDAVAVTTRQILVNSKAVGNSTMIVWTRTGQRTFYNVTVEMNLEPLRQLLKESFPNEPITLYSSRDAVAMTGEVSSKDVADRAGILAASFSKTVLNNLTLPKAPAEKQILLRVKFAELDREKEVQYGVNLLAGPGGNPIGGGTGQFPGYNFSGSIAVPPTSSGTQTTCTVGGCQTTTSGNGGTFSITQALNLFALDPKLNLGAFIKALQNETVLQILAEPTLVTTNGKEASFLVGGQFPVPIVQGGATSGAISVQFKDYGIKLVFTPNITPNTNISIHLKQEVTALDTANSVALNGFSIPALSSRTAESTVELGDGQSFVVAGLLNNQEQYALSKVPFISSLPIIGNLFKSKDDKVQRQELIMIVTPEVTMPLGPNDPKPDIYMPKDFLKKLDPKDVPPQPAANRKK